MRKLSLLLLSIIFIFSNPASAQVKEEDPSGRVIIVLDASGSMWGMINGQHKITIAKEVVKDLLKDWDPAVAVGLTAYGHRRKGDCEDIEAVVPLGKLDKGAFINSLDKLNAKGKTPLSQAVMLAAEELKYTEERATVILVSDGKETCDKDPCALAKQLEESGVNFTTHVVGFDVSKKEEIAQLNCIAENTGGKFLLAENAASLKQSLNVAVQIATEIPPGVTLAAVNEEGGPELDNVGWKIFPKVESEMLKAKAITTSRAPTPEIDLPPGFYVAEVRSMKGQAKATKEFEVKADSRERVEVILAEEGEIELVAVTQPGTEPLANIRWRLFAPPTKELNKPTLLEQGPALKPVYRLLPGKYIIKARSIGGDAEAEQEIEVIGGKKTKAEVIMPLEGILAPVAVYQSGGTPLDYVYWKIYKKGSAGSKTRGKIVGSNGKTTPEFKLLLGKYIVTAKSTGGTAEVQQEVEVTSEGINDVEIIFPEEGLLKLSAVSAESGAPVTKGHWRVYTIPENALTKGKLVHAGSKASPEYKVLPGRYLVKLSSVGRKAEMEVQVFAGKRTEQQLQIK